MATEPEGLESGLEHHHAGRINDAERIYRAALDRDPGDAEANHLLGVLCFERGRASDAIPCFENAVAAAPRIAKYQANLGSVLAAIGRFDEALVTLEQAITLDPAAAAPHCSLATVYQAQGRIEDSIAAYRRAIEIEPGFARAHNNLAVTLLLASRPDEALESAAAAVAADQRDAQCHNTLGTVLAALRRGDEAMRRFERAVALAPDFTEVRRNLARALGDKQRHRESESQFREVIALQPDDGAGHAGLARALRLQGRHSEALPHFRKSVALTPDNPRYHSNLLFNIIASPEMGEGDIFDEHRKWNRNFAAPLAAAGATHANKRDPDRRLRIGYVSPDFHDHPVGRLSLPVLAAHDRDGFEVFCYGRVRRPDEITERLRAAVACYRETVNKSDAAVADLVRADGIDILVDLAGHTARHRLLAFARKPAPVQATWLGYLSTTGLDAIDYLIGDPVHTPDGCEAAFSERIKRMPHCLVCAAPPPVAADTGPPPMAANGHVTFGVFNNPSKMTAPVIALWSRILDAVPGARLLLKFRGLEDDGVATYLRTCFTECGIDAARLELRGASPYSEVLAAYHGVDLALDTTPYSGTATTLESLSMGVPVVALCGDRMVSRSTAAILNAAGLDELVAGDGDGYVATAVALAGDGKRLAELRAGMGARLAGSPLYDVTGFTRDLEALYRDMWREWCAR